MKKKEALRVIIDDILFLRTFLKGIRLYDCKQLSYNDTHYFHIHDKNISIYKTIDGKVLYISLHLNKLSNCFKHLHKNPGILNTFKVWNYFYRNMEIQIWNQSFKKSNKVPDRERTLNADALVLLDILPKDIVYHIMKYSSKWTPFN